MLIYSIMMLLLSSAINNRRDSAILYSRIAILVLFNTLILTYNISYFDFFYKGITIYNGLLIVKGYLLFFIIFLLVLSIFILSVNSYLPGKIVRHNIKELEIFINKMSDQYRILEYPLIILFCLAGSIFLISSINIISMFLALELQSYGLYLISSIYRNSESSIKGGLTYFLLGSLSSCLILLGISLLYINTGNTSLDNIFIINSISNSISYNIISEEIFLDKLWIYNYVFNKNIYIQLPMEIICVGFLFKISSAPFHFWSPLVYDAIPTVVTTFVAIIAKISLLLILLELIIYTDNTTLIYSWTNNILLSSILSLLIGSVLGLVQYRIKRLYAYSTISNIGFILLSLSINCIESFRAFIFYIVQYSISNLNAFIILIAIGYNLYLYTYKIKKTDKYSPVQFISQIKGLYEINPILSISLAITLFSFIGIPPLIGFFGKQMVLSVALDKGFIFSMIVGIITSVISAVYYLIIIKLMFFDRKNYVLNTFNLNYINYTPIVNNIPVSSSLSFIISFLTLFILLFMFMQKELIKLVFILM